MLMHAGKAPRQPRSQARRSKRRRCSERGVHLALRIVTCSRCRMYVNHNTINRNAVSLEQGPLPTSMTCMRLSLAISSNTDEANPKARLFCRWAQPTAACSITEPMLAKGCGLRCGPRRPTDICAMQEGDTSAGHPVGATSEGSRAKRRSREKKSPALLFCRWAQPTAVRSVTEPVLARDCGLRCGPRHPTDTCVTQ
jgi:hypothetical protein